MNRNPLAPILLLALLAAPASARPYLVQDLNTAPTDEGALALAGAGLAHEGVFYFSASDPAHGVELWRTDGTPNGTFRLTDACPGPCDSNPSDLAPFRGKIAFRADDGIAGREPWTTDGAPGGERRLRDLCPGPCSSDPTGFTEFAGRLFFITRIDGRGELWSSNGSRRGTRLVRVLCDDSCTYFPVHGTFRGRLYFSSAGPYSATTWWSDGTPEGTAPAPELRPGVRSFVKAGDDFGFLWTLEGLWRTDGTASGTRLLRPISELLLQPGRVTVPYSHGLWNGILFTLLDGGELVRSDGTPEGTYRIAELAPGIAAGYLTPAGDRLYFFVFRHRAVEVWQTRGTRGTTRKVEEAPGHLAGTSALGDRVVFRMLQEGPGSPGSLWVSDGTEEGTCSVSPATGNHFAGPFTAGGLAYFADGTPLRPEELLVTDGTPAGTRLVRDFGDLPGSAGPVDQAALGGRLIFSARTGSGEAPLFASDGTPGGTAPLAEAHWARGFQRVGGRLFFASHERLGRSGDEPLLESRALWWTDGTPRGTRRVRRGILSYGSPSALDGRLVFAASYRASESFWRDVELWRSDGTHRGTHLLQEINPFLFDTQRHHLCGHESSDPGPGVAAGGLLYLAAGDGIHGRELWATDGTRPGTRLVRDIHPGRSRQPPLECPDALDPRTETALSSNPTDLVRIGRGVLFSADDGAHGRELWKSDGSRRGTGRVADLLPGPGGSAPHHLTAWRGAVYFFAARPGGGEGLWRSDGTARGTRLVKDLFAGTGCPSWGLELRAAGNRLFLAVYNEATGAELWTSRGDAASTRMVADLRPGAPSSAPRHLTAVGNAVVFAADDGDHGLEAWTSDGTAAGTFRLGDLAPGRDASAPGPFTAIEGFVLTGADDGLHGRELWAIPLGDLDPR